MADIILKDRDGNDEIYEGVKAVKFNTTDGGTQTFMEGETTTTNIEPDFLEGNVVVTPEEGKFFSEVTVLKPENLIPENIAKDVVVAGITGTLEAGGDGTQIDFTDENLKFFGYKLDNENNLIYICFIDYEKIYEHTGSYDVNIPSTIGGYEVVLVCA